MFSNNFIGEETDELFTDSLKADYAKHYGQEQATANSRIKTELPEQDDENDGLLQEANADDSCMPTEQQQYHVGNNGNKRTRREIDEEEVDDNALLFNFQMDFEVKDTQQQQQQQHYKVQLRPAVKPVASPVRAAAPLKLDYDAYIIFVCPCCGEEMDSNEKWKRHVDFVHQYGTKHGLNFQQVDKLYHKCLECKRNIAMHSMENLIKHKFTHLPFRRAKCRICLKQFKYRQDIVGHLRMYHHEELATLAKAVQAETTKRYRIVMPSANFMEIKNVQENAHDIFAGSRDELIPLRNEALPVAEETQQQAKANAANLTLEDSLSRSSHASDSSSVQQIPTDSTEQPAHAELCEKYNIFICPQCGFELDNQAAWHDHIVKMHGFGTPEGLNFEMNNKQQAQCRECQRIIHTYSLTLLKQHKFSHLPYKQWLRCKLCFRALAGIKESIKHLKSQHRLGNEGTEGEDNCDSQGYDDDMVQEMEEEVERTSRDDRTNDAFENYVDYLCPQCGKEFGEKKYWRRHIVKAHHLTDLKVLNFRIVNDSQVCCLECGKIITNAYGVQNPQQHRFTHLPYKSYVRCRLCLKSYTDRKGLLKHLQSRHRVSEGYTPWPRNSAVQANAPEMVANNNKSMYEARANDYYGGTFGQETHKNKPGNAADCSKTYEPNSSGFSEHHPYEYGGAAASFAEATYDSKKFLQSDAQLYDDKTEIVRHDNLTFEIKYLDEDDEDDESSSCQQRYDDSFDDDAPVPELSFNDVPFQRKKPTQSASQFKCEQCCTLFATEACLQMHIQATHRAKDVSYNNYSTRTENASYAAKLLPDNDDNSCAASAADQQQQHHDHQDTNDDLLVPLAAVAAPNECSEPNAAGYGSLERNYCYLCPNCGVECATQMLWRRHINEAHNYDNRVALNFRQIDKYRFECMECKLIVMGLKLKQLQDHKFRHCQYRLYIKCRLCGACYNHRPNMESHLRMKHNLVDASRPQTDYSAEARQHEKPMMIQPKAKNSSPGKSAANVTDGMEFLVYHNAVDHQCISYNCPECDAPFPTHVDWRRHIVLSHNLNSKQGLNFRQIDEHHFLCLQCYKRVTVTHTKGAIGQLQSHKFRHLPFRSFKCKQCGGEFLRKQMFFKHLNKATNMCDTSPEEVARKNRELQEKEELDDSKMQTSHANAIAEPPQLFETQSNDAAGATLQSEDSSGISRLEACYILVCPQCGEQFKRLQQWRDHINNVHGLGRRESLNFIRTNSSTNECQQCFEHVNGNKLRDLQIHKFKHLPYGAWLQCKHCLAAYYHVANMHDHIRYKHADMLEEKKAEQTEDDITFPPHDAKNDAAARKEEPYVLE